MTFLLCFLVFNFVPICFGQNPVVQTNVGSIRGLRASDGEYDMYLGIPYAQVDINNPFGAHIIQPPFEEPFNAFYDSAYCPQENEQTGDIFGTIDCLHLNVYVPDLVNYNKSLPVMVWIHGGAFVTGASNRNVYGPKFLVKHDVIVVTINYRVSVYGFMCLDIPEVPGNQGLKDQEAALRWVKTNIRAFGGDDNTITVFGESAGGVSVDLQFRFGDPELFDKIIMQSGSASSNWGIQEPDYKYANKLAQYLGYETSDTKDAVEFLSKANPHDVTAATVSVSVHLLWPCVEKEFDGVTRFIDDYTMNLNIPRAQNKPFLFGVNNEEWLVRYILEDDEYFKTLNIFQQNLNEGFQFPSSNVIEMEKIVKQFYVGDNELSKEEMRNIADFDTDFTFIHPAERSINEYIENGASNVYRYMFRYSGDRNLLQNSMNVKVDGAFHADDLGYLFDVLGYGVPNKEDQLIIDRLTLMWTNFAKYGDPTPEISEVIPIRWSAVAPGKSYYLDIDSDVVVGTRPFHERMAFWDLFFEYNHKYRVGNKN